MEEKMKQYSNSDINQVLYDSIDALLIVYSKENKYESIKCSETISKIIANEGSYQDLVETLWFHISNSDTRITDEYRVFLPKMGEFKGRYAQKAKVNIDGEKHVLEIMGYPIDQSEGDYTIVISDLGSSITERDVFTENKVKTMQETYLFSMYVDLNKDFVSSINISEISNDDMHYDVKYSDWRMMIVNTIWPEDQPMFLEKTNPEYLMGNLKPGKTLSFDCQMMNLEGEYLWVKLIFGRTDTTSESDFRFVFMVQNIHENSMQLFTELKKFENLASHDTLTGVFNHGRIETELGNAIAGLKNDNKQASLMMFDIDFFKSINDNYGHAIGDDVLKEFVNVIQAKIQEHDIKIGRWGGEEFVCVCYDMNAVELGKLAEEIRCAIEKTVFEHISSMTCSVGLTDVRIEDTVKEAFVRLDSALYEAKANGRNCVKLHE